MKDTLLHKPLDKHKSKAYTAISYPFQGKVFHPCVGLMYSIRWGEYELGIRALRGYLGLKEEQKADFKRTTQATFCAMITQIVDKIGDRDFFEVCEAAAEHHRINNPPMRYRRKPGGGLELIKD